MLEMERYIVGRSRFPHGKAWTFECALCGNVFEYDQPGEPLCTGPSESTDDHPPEMMFLKSIRTVDKVEKLAPPGVAQRRQEGPLYIPGQGIRDEENLRKVGWEE